MPENRENLKLYPENILISHEENIEVESICSDDSLEEKINGIDLGSHLEESQSSISSWSISFFSDKSDESMVINDKKPQDLLNNK